MVIKRWCSAFFLIVVLPTAVLLIDPTAFFVLMSLLTLTVSCSSLKKLAILNFAPDSYFERCAATQTCVPETSKEKTLKRVMIFGLHILLLVFFAYTFYATELLWLKATAVIVALCWIVDMIRTHFSLNRSTADDDDSWTLKDTLSEGFIWFQNLASIILVVAAFATKFFM